MNTKAAKLLRFETRYHPTMPRKYYWHTVKVQRPNKDGGMRNVERSILMLEDSDPRILYKEAKKEYYANGASK